MYVFIPGRKDNWLFLHSCIHYHHVRMNQTILTFKKQIFTQGGGDN